jgi:hypothetical protein
LRLVLDIVLGWLWFGLANVAALALTADTSRLEKHWELALIGWGPLGVIYVLWGILRDGWVAWREGRLARYLIGG